MKARFKLVVFLVLLMVTILGVTSANYLDTPKFNIVNGYELTDVVDNNKIRNITDFYDLYKTKKETNVYKDKNVDADIIGTIQTGSVVPIDNKNNNSEWGYSSKYSGYLYIPELDKITPEETIDYIIVTPDGYSDRLEIYDGHYIHLNNGTFVSIDDKDKWAILPADRKTIREMKYTQIEILENIRKEAVKEQDLYTVTNPSYMTADEIGELIRGTELEGIEWAVKQVEHDYGINALYTISVAAHESAWGKSFMSQYKNNLFGIGAYDYDLDQAFTFGSKGECVMYWGRMIKENYVDQGLTTPEAINSKYASDKEWSIKVRNMAYEFKSNIDL